MLAFKVILLYCFGHPWRRTIFSSLAHILESGLTKRKSWGFPQVKLDSETNARFLLNECQLHENIYNISGIEKNKNILILTL